MPTKDLTKGGQPVRPASRQKLSARRTASIIDQARLLWFFLLKPAQGLKVIESTSPWLVPLVLFSIGAATINYLTLPLGELITRMQMPPAVNPNDVANALRIQRTAQTVATLFTPVLLCAKWVFMAGTLYLATIIVKGRMRFRHAYSLVAFSSFPLLLRSLTMLIIVSFEGTSELHTARDLMPPIGLNLLFRNLGTGWYTFLHQFNIFDFWYLGLLGLGVTQLNCFPRWKGATVAFCAWLLAIGLEAAVTSLVSLQG